MKLRVLIAVVFAASLTACSGGLFSDGKDPSVLAYEPTRKPNPACSHLDLGRFDSESGFRTDQFRALLGCLNGNGALEPLVVLTDRLSDSDLTPVARTFHELFLKDPKSLRDFRQSYEQWADSGFLTQDLNALGSALFHEKLFGAFAGGLGKVSANSPRFFDALPILARGLGVDSLEAAIAVLESPAWKSLVGHLNESGQSPHTRKDLARALHRYIRAQRGSVASSGGSGIDLDQQVLSAVANGKLFAALDRFEATQKDGHDLRAVVSRLAALIRQLAESRPGIFSRNDSALFSRLLTLASGVHVPISCLGSGGEVPDGISYVLGELALRSSPAQIEQLFRRDLQIDLAMMSAFCEYPRALSQYFSTYQELTSSTTLRTSAPLVHALAVEGLSPLVVDALAGRAGSPSPLVELLPLFSELQDRGAFEDILLLAVSIKKESRGRIMELAQMWTRSREELGGASIHEAFYDAAIAVGEDGFERAFDVGAALLEEQGPLLSPALSSLRRVYFLNHVHPILERLRAWVSNPALPRELFAALDRMDKNHPREFFGAIGFFRDHMTREPSKLRSLVGSFLAMTQYYAAGAAGGGLIRPGQPAPVPTPADLQKLLAHAWSKKDLVVSLPEPLPEWPGCSKLGPLSRPDDYKRGDYPEFVEEISACIGSDGIHTDLARNLVEYLAGRKTSSGRPILHHLIDDLKELDLSQAAVRELMHWASGDDARSGLVKAVAGVSEFFSKHRLQDLSPVLSNGREQILALMKGLGSALKSPDFVPAMGALSASIEASRTQPVLPEIKDDQVFWDSAFKDVLGRYECVAQPSLVHRRAGVLVEDYRHAVLGTELDSMSDRPYHQWPRSMLELRLEPILEQLADRRNGLADGLVGFVAGFATSAERLEEARRWFSQRSNDWRVIPYFYPDQDRPRAKVVSSLDMLELLVSNADFEFVLPGNFSLKFLASMALAWGDEPREEWPEMVKRMYPGRSRPPTLQEAFSEIMSTLRLAENVIGYPRLPDCSDAVQGPVRQGGLLPLWVKARVFNMRQTVAAIAESLPGAAGPNAGGARLLRELSFSLYQSTPERFRNPGAGNSNHLSLASRLASLGVLRQLGRGIRIATLDENPELGGLFMQAFEGMVGLAATPSFSQVLHGAVAGRPQHRLVQHFVQKLTLEPGEILSLLFAASAMRDPALARVASQNLAVVLRDSASEIEALAPVLVGVLNDPAAAAALKSLDQSEELRRLAAQMGGMQAGRLLSSDVLSLVSLLRASGVDVMGSPAAITGLGPIVEFFSEQNPRAMRAGREVRHFVADRLLVGAFNVYVDWLIEDPDGAAQLIATVGKTSVNGELLELLKKSGRAFDVGRPGARN